MTVVVELSENKADILNTVITILQVASDQEFVSNKQYIKDTKINQIYRNDGLKYAVKYNLVLKLPGLIYVHDMREVVYKITPEGVRYLQISEQCQY